MKRILFITNSLNFGGAAKMLAFVASSLAERGHGVYIANLNTTGYKTEFTQTIHKDITVFDVAAKGKLGIIKELIGIGKQHKIDVMVGFTGFPGFYARIAGMKLRIPSIMSERGDPSRTTPKTLKARLVLSVINGSRGCVFQTEGAREFYSKGLQKRSAVIPNPIFVQGEVPQVAFEEREKTVVSVGRLDNEQKRYDVMLDAFKIFSEKHPEYTLKLYGRGGDEDQIKAWATERGLDERVKFMGLTKQPMQDTCRDGMFLITSDYEGISNSLLEAMAVGLPCVSTDHTPGGARLLITDHENGLLAPVEDAAALARAMCELADDPELAKRCGDAAKDVLVRFAPERIIDMWESYIEKIANRK